jgi:hypothetical protein
MTASPQAGYTTASDLSHGVVVVLVDVREESIYGLLARYLASSREPLPKATEQLLRC